MKSIRRLAVLIVVVPLVLVPVAIAGAAAAARSHATPPIGTQLAELKGSDTVVGDKFGAVAISGTTLVVGAPGHANSVGSAYIFTKTATGWKQVAELKGSGTPVAISGTTIVVGVDDYFGTSVAISGTTVVVGAFDEAHVFTKSASGWRQTAELKGSDTAISDYFGCSVAISGTTVVIGADGHANRAGRTYVFTKSASGWRQAAELKGSGTVAGDMFGGSVAISGTTVVVGASEHFYHAGRAYVFTKSPTGWRQTAQLKGSDTAEGDFFGSSVAISGETAVVGAPEHDNSAGTAYVFTKSASGWKQTAELKGYDTPVDAGFGDRAAIWGTTTVVGASGYANAAGRVYVFTKTAIGWKQTAELKGSDTVGYNASSDTQGDMFGDPVAIWRTTAVVGAPRHAATAGEVYVFEV